MTGAFNLSGPSKYFFARFEKTLQEKFAGSVQLNKGKRLNLI
jgi:hypothetical protein